MALGQVALELGDRRVIARQSLADRQRFLVSPEGILLVADLVRELGQLETRRRQACERVESSSPCSIWSRSRSRLKNSCGSFSNLARSGASAGLFFSSGDSRITSPNRFTASIASCSRSSARAFLLFGRSFCLVASVLCSSACPFCTSASSRPSPRAPLAIGPQGQPDADRRRGDEEDGERPDGRQRHAVLAGELPQLVRRLGGQASTGSPSR